MYLYHTYAFLSLGLANRATAIESGAQRAGSDCAMCAILERFRLGHFASICLWSPTLLLNIGLSGGSYQLDVPAQAGTRPNTSLHCLSGDGWSFLLWLSPTHTLSLSLISSAALLFSLLFQLEQSADCAVTNTNNDTVEYKTTRNCHTNLIQHTERVYVCLKGKEICSQRGTPSPTGIDKTRIASLNVQCRQWTIGDKRIETVIITI